MQPPASYPLHFGGGTLRFPNDHDAERRRIDERIARERLKLAELEVERARVDEREARERANRELGVIR